MRADRKAVYLRESGAARAQRLAEERLLRSLPIDGSWTCIPAYRRRTHAWYAIAGQIEERTGARGRIEVRRKVPR